MIRVSRLFDISYAVDDRKDKLHGASPQVIITPDWPKLTVFIRPVERNHWPAGRVIVYLLKACLCLQHLPASKSKT